jgi:hypothetical protein
MKIHTFSEDTLEKLNKKQKDLQETFSKISNFTLKDFWMDDIQ